MLPNFNLNNAGANGGPGADPQNAANAVADAARAPAAALPVEEVDRQLQALNMNLENVAAEGLNFRFYIVNI